MLKLSSGSSFLVHVLALPAAGSNSYLKGTCFGWQKVSQMKTVHFKASMVAWVDCQLQKGVGHRDAKKAGPVLSTVSYLRKAYGDRCLE